MREMTSRQRVQNTLCRRPVDRIAAMLMPWPATIEKWKELGQCEDLTESLNLDIRFAGFINNVADIELEDKIIEENETSILVVDGNGATLRKRKDKTGTPEHVNFRIKQRQDWLEYIKPHLEKADERRFYLDEYKREYHLACKHERFMILMGCGPFEQMHPICGHENLLMAMIDDPVWVREMVETYVDFSIRHFELLFEKQQKPNAIWFYEDMGFKGKPFMSPSMYSEILAPGHKRLFDFVHSLELKVIVHSCGFVEPLVPGLLEAGMDCLQGMEVKAGMDMPNLFRKFGDRIAFFGGIDARTLISNDLQQIDAELKSKMLPVIEHGGSYILHSDHSEPPEVDYTTAQFFINHGRELALEAMRK